MLSRGLVGGMAATKVIRRGTCLSGCQDQGLWERMRSSSAWDWSCSQLLTHPQMVVRSPRDGSRLCTPKKHQGVHGRAKVAWRGCTDLRIHSSCFLKGPRVPVLRETRLQGWPEGELRSWANRLNSSPTPFPVPHFVWKLVRKARKAVHLKAETLLCRLRSV